MIASFRCRIKPSPDISKYFVVEKICPKLFQTTLQYVQETFITFAEVFQRRWRNLEIKSTPYNQMLEKYREDNDGSEAALNIYPKQPLL